jgi:transporter family protein|tara:strand:+ start:479 stop:904 length:426 start_codon:yes stop_codon:yes gene_type:complete
MGYLAWAGIGMFSYGFAVFFTKVSLKYVPSEIVVLITNGILVVMSLIFFWINRHSVLSQLDGNISLGVWSLMGIAGGFLGLAVMSFYHALSRGEASVVAPIFSMSFVVAVCLSLVFLGEDIKITKILGVIFAGIAIFLVTR